MDVIVLVNIALYAFVVYMICRRAYVAYKYQFKSWPILALLALLYVVFGATWRFLRVDTNVFWIASVICVYASRAIYSASRNAGN